MTTANTYAVICYYAITINVQVIGQLIENPLLKYGTKCQLVINQQYFYIIMVIALKKVHVIELTKNEYIEKKSHSNCLLVTSMLLYYISNHYLYNNDVHNNMIKDLFKVHTSL